MNSNTRPKPWESQRMGEDTGIANQTSTGTNTLPPEVPPLPESTSMNNNNNNNNNSDTDNFAYENNNNRSYGMGNNSMYGLGGGGGMYGANGSGLYGGTTFGGLYGGNTGYGFGGYGAGTSGYGYGYGGVGGMNMQNGFNSFGGMNGPGIVTESTMATFQLLENLIGAINGFAQMLESSYMATYNSFFTLVSFAEELGRLKQFMGSLFGMFNVFKLLKRIIFYMKGRRKLANNGIKEGDRNPFTQEFKDGMNKVRSSDDKYGSRQRRRRLAWKPLILFFMGVFGFPYLLKKYINRVQNSHLNQLLSKGLVDEPIDPMNLEFARAIYDFIPENPTIEITLKKGDLMAIISRRDTLGKESSWWRVRTKQGDVGYVPSNYIEIIKRRKA